MKHIEFEKLVDHFEGRLSDSDTCKIDSHVGSCLDCQAESARLSDFFAYSALGAAEAVPQATTARILNIFQRQPIPVEAIDEKPFASGFLIFDDWAMALNERYSGLDSRQMLFRVNDHDIDLRIEFIEGRCILSGQVFPELPEAKADIRSSTVHAAVGFTEFGEFVFEPVPMGDYDLRINFDNEEFIIENLPLRS